MASPHINKHRHASYRGAGIVTDPVAPTFTEQPTIVGAVRVGETLTVTWEHSGFPSPEWRVQWSVGGDDVSLPSSLSYTIQPGDLGKPIAATVDLKNRAGADSATSEPTGPVEPAGE